MQAIVHHTTINYYSIGITLIESLSGTEYFVLGYIHTNKLKITILRATASKPHSNPGPNLTHTGIWPTVYYLLEFYLVSCVCSFCLLA
jgi:hypothetical protein